MANNTLNCLIIDDSDQEATIERIESDGKKIGLEIKCYEFNVGSQKEQSLFYNEGKISIERVIEEFDKRFTGIKLHLIAFDYDLEDAEADRDKKVNGLRLIQQIGQKRISADKLLYSSEIDELIKEIVNSYNRNGDIKSVKESIRALFVNGIVDFAGKEDYNTKIINILRSSASRKNTVDGIIESKMREYGDYTFKSIYPPFKNKKLKEIADIIESDRTQGYNFKSEIVEQTISNMIQLND